MLFNEEISKVDPAFFIRLKESNLLIEDREDINKTGKYTVFNDKDYNDKDFHKDFPTVYHLRKELIESKTPHDIRLVFIALHHIIKKRGHFLFDTDVSDIPRFEEVYKDLTDYLSDNYEIDFLLANRNKICPIEVKSSGYKTHKSLDEFCKKYSDRILDKYLVYTKDLAKDSDILCLPVYMVPFL